MNGGEQAFILRFDIFWQRKAKWSNENGKEW